MEVGTGPSGFGMLAEGNTNAHLEAIQIGSEVLAFSPDGQKLVSGGEDTAIRLWNVVTGKFKRTISGHTGPVLSVTFSPDGETIASGSVDKTIRLWKFPP